MDLPHTTKQLIIEARDGDDVSTNRLLRIIRDEHMPPRLYRYKNRNVLIDDDHLESEFLLGVFNAIGVVDPDRGNPLLYLLWRGQMKVATYCRQTISKGIRLSCECGYEGRPAYRSGVTRCPSCDSKRAKTRMRTISLEPTEDMDGFDKPMGYLDLHDLDEIEIEKDLAFDRATHALAIEEMRARLSGRQLELFDLMVMENINGQTSQNYLKEIGARWGVSPQRVSQVLRQLRKAVIEYYEG